MTSYYNTHDNHQPAVTIALPCPTTDPLLLTRAAKEMLPKILNGVKCARAGIAVTDIRPPGAQEIFEPFVPLEAKDIGPQIQKVKQRHGVNAVRLGLAGMKTGTQWTCAGR